MSRRPAKAHPQRYRQDFDPPTPASIAAAKAAQAAEREDVVRATNGRVYFTADGRPRLRTDLEIALQIQNAIVAAVFGTAGELRDRRN